MRQVEGILSHQPARVLDSKSIFSGASDLGATTGKVDEYLEAEGISHTSLGQINQASRSSIAMELPLDPTPKKISQSKHKTARSPHNPDFRDQEDAMPAASRFSGRRTHSKSRKPVVI